MPTPLPPSPLDLATAHLTAFASWASLVEDMDATGYFPTIRADKAVGKLRPEALALRKALVASGRRVFPAWGEYRDEKVPA